MFAGLPLFIAVCILTALPYAFPQTGFWPVLALLALWALTPSRPGPKTRRVSRSEKASSAMQR